MRQQGLAWWRPLVIASCLTVATCTNCYYPNGNLSPSNNDQPCSTQKGASCCPLNWQCLDNGLCYYPPDNYYGRYGCTDQSWQSPYCPSGLCTNDLIAAGDEAIVQCSNKDNKWCCDGDRIHVKCCSNDSLTYFDLPDGNVFATIGSGSTPTTAPVVNTFDSNPSSTAKSSAAKSSAAHSSAAPSTDAASSTAQPTSATLDSTSFPTSAAAYTTIRTSLTTGSGGAIATVYITSAIVPTAAPTPAPHPSHTGLIVGCAVGIPLGLALLGLLAFLLRRRHNSPSPDPNDPNDTIYAGTYKAPHRAQAQLPPELGGEPVGAGRPISVLKGRAELEGTPRSVAASSLSSPPPGYSPGMMGAGGWGAERYSGGAAAAGVGVGQESTPGGRYISYRPPMEGVQERVELAGG